MIAKQYFIAAGMDGHNKQCKILKFEREEKRKNELEEYNIRQNRSIMPPLDINLDPKGLWSEGILLSRSGLYADAAWKLLLALFMDASLDGTVMLSGGRDKKHVMLQMF